MAASPLSGQKLVLETPDTRQCTVCAPVHVTFRKRPIQTMGRGASRAVSSGKLSRLRQREPAGTQNAPGFDAGGGYAGRRYTELDA